MIHKLTLTTYFITSFVKKHSIKNVHKSSLCILTKNCYSPPSFNISVQNVAMILPKSGATQNSFSTAKDQALWKAISWNCERKNCYKIKIFGHFLSRRPLKTFSSKILLDNNITRPLNKEFSKNVYYMKRITLSEA